MFKVINKSNILTAAILFLMPVTLIFFLSSQMAYSQVKGKFEEYQTIPEVTSLTELESMPVGKVVILRGQISEDTPFRGDAVAPNLIVFQERPAGGREVRYQEEFPLVFPGFIIDLPDGSAAILPSQTRERVIQNELHTVVDGDRERTGFRIGDTVTVQGEWQPEIAVMPALDDVTGITSIDKQSLIADWEDAFQKVSWARNGLGLLTLISLILLVVQLRRIKSNKKSEEADAWQNQETKTAPTTSP